MLVNGREVGFRRSVRASADLSEICPGKNIERFGELITGKDATTATQLTALAAMASVLSEAWCKHRAKSGADDVPEPLTIEEILDLDEDEYNVVITEASNAFRKDIEHTVEARPAPKKKGPAPVKSK